MSQRAPGYRFQYQVPPTSSASSSTTDVNPASRSRCRRYRPANPAPTTATSTWWAPLVAREPAASDMAFLPMFLFVVVWQNVGLTAAAIERYCASFERYCDVARLDSALPDNAGRQAHAFLQCAGHVRLIAETTRQRDFHKGQLRRSNKRHHAIEPLPHHELIGTDAKAALETADEMIGADAGGPGKIGELEIERQMSFDKIQAAALLGWRQSRCAARAAKLYGMMVKVSERTDRQRLRQRIDQQRAAGRGRAELGSEHICEHHRFWIADIEHVARHKPPIVRSESV